MQRAGDEGMWLQEGSERQTATPTRSAHLACTVDVQIETKTCDHQGDQRDPFFSPFSIPHATSTLISLRKCLEYLLGLRGVKSILVAVLVSWG